MKVDMLRALRYWEHIVHARDEAKVIMQGKPVGERGAEVSRYLELDNQVQYALRMAVELGLGECFNEN